VGKAKTKAEEEHRRAETRRRWLHLKQMLVKHSVLRADAKAKKEVHILSGLYQQHERHMVQDAALNLEQYSNRRMKLVAVLDSIPVNLVLVCNVIVDVTCMLFFSLQFLVDNDDCFGRDVPLQHMIMLICLSIYTTELLLRGVGHGFRDHYGPHRRNIPNILDASVILGHFPSQLYIVHSSDRVLLYDISFCAISILTNVCIHQSLPCWV
jgi:hypothetical protein